jgi:protease I
MRTLWTLAAGTVLCAALGCAGREQTRQDAPAPGKALEGKKIALVIAPDKFRDEELAVPREHFLAHGGLVKVFCSKLGEVTGMLGAKVKPDADLSRLRPAEWDAVVFVGGSGAQVYFEDERVLAIARDAAAKCRVVGAICIAPCILANAGLLKGRSATVWSGMKKALVDKGAKVVDRAVVTDGNLVTGDGPGAAKEFAETIAGMLAE